MFVVRSEFSGDEPPQFSSALSFLLRSLEPGTSVQFDAFDIEAEARLTAGAVYRRLSETTGAWTAPPRYAVYAEWEVSDPKHYHAFEESRLELFELRRQHLPSFAFDWLLKSLEHEGRYLVLGLYGDEEGAARLCRLHAEIQPYIQAHPPSLYAATDLTGLRIFRVEAPETR